MATTPKYALPSPDVLDPGDGPTQMQALAQAVEDLLSTGVLDMTGGTVKIAAPAADSHPLRRVDVQIGPAASVPDPLPTGTVYLGY